MSQTRKKVRDALKAVLSDGTYGFNAQYALIQAAYGLTDPLEIDWRSGSRNFFQGYLEPGNAPESQLSEYPAAVLSTSDATPTDNTHQKVIQARLAFIISHSYRDDETDAIEADDTESEIDAIEEAVENTLRRADIPWQPTHGVTFANEISTSRSPLALLGDGCQQWLFCDLIFQVEY